MCMDALVHGWGEGMNFCHPWLFLIGLFSPPLKGRPPNCSNNWWTNSISVSPGSIEMGLIMASEATKVFGAMAGHGLILGGGSSHCWGDHRSNEVNII